MKSEFYEAKKVLGTFVNPLEVHVKLAALIRIFILLHLIILLISSIIILLNFAEKSKF